MLVRRRNHITEPRRVNVGGAARRQTVSPATVDSSSFTRAELWLTMTRFLTAEEPANGLRMLEAPLREIIGICGLLVLHSCRRKHLERQSYEATNAAKC